MSDPAPAAAKPAAPAKSGLSWGLPLFLVFMCLAIALGAEFLFNEKRSIDYVIETLFKLVPPVIIIVIVVAVIRNANSKSDH